MSRIPCKICRRIGFSVCGREKCAFRRKPYPPGMHGKKSRRGTSEFSAQLREKQKLRSLYHLREQQFKNYVQAAMQAKGEDAGEKLMEFLERRLDNAVYTAGFTNSLSTARQLVSHGHIVVNGRKVKIPSFSVKMGDSIGLAARSRQSNLFKDFEVVFKKHVAPAWMNVDREAWEAKVTGKPEVNDSAPLHNTKLIIEYYAR